MTSQSNAAAAAGSWPASPAGVVRSTIRWTLKGAWAILDQGLFSLTNFVINVALARWLAPEGYGAFTLAYAVFLMLGTVHTALLAEPMLVFGAAKYRERLPAYLALLMQGHWLLTAPSSVMLAVIGGGLWFAGQAPVGIALVTLAAANPFILLLWFMRRACYVGAEPHLAASGGIIYMAILTSGVYLLFRSGWLSSPAGLLLMAAGSTVAALWIRSRLPLRPSGGGGGFHRSVAMDHWRYGRWAVGTGLLGAVMLNLYYVMLPARHGLESAATLKALTNLVMPAMQTYVALSLVIVPALVQRRGTPAFGSVVRRLLIIYSAGAFLYWLSVGISHRSLVQWLYQGQYDAESHLLWLLGLVPVATGGMSILESALRAHERTNSIFRAHVLAALSTCLVGIPCLTVWGTGGAIAGLLISSWLAVCSMAFSLRRLLRSQGLTPRAAVLEKAT